MIVIFLLSVSACLCLFVFCVLGGHGGKLIFHDISGKLVESDAKQLTPATPDAIADILTTTAKLAQ